MVHKQFWMQCLKYCVLNQAKQAKMVCLRLKQRAASVHGGLSPVFTVDGHVYGSSNPTMAREALKKMEK